MKKNEFESLPYTIQKIILRQIRDISIKGKVINLLEENRRLSSWLYHKQVKHFLNRQRFLKQGKIKIKP